MPIVLLVIGKATISNDGATIMKLLDVVHPAARSLVDIARAQDAEVGDGTTSVVLLAGELLSEVRSFIEDGMAPRNIIQGFRMASEMALQRISEISVSIDTSDGKDQQLRELLEKCASTSMNSKLIHSQDTFFKKLVVDAVMMLDRESLRISLIGMKKIPGGALQDTRLIQGVAFKKTFSYAGFEQQPKKFSNPPILMLNIELELKAERDNAEIRMDNVGEYQAVVEAEWTILYDKLEKISSTGAKVVLSRLPIGDVATQYFADRDIFCAGRVPQDDLSRVCEAVGGSVQSSVQGLAKNILGECSSFEEVQIGGERYNVFTGCPAARSCTFLLRGGSEQYISEVERSLHDAIMVVKRAIHRQRIVAGGGAAEMALSKSLRDSSKIISGKMQRVVQAFAKAFEVIPRQLCFNAGFDAIDVLTQLRKRHAQGDSDAVYYGVDMANEGVGNLFEQCVWEPALVKINMISAATEAACLILSIDETVRAPLPPSADGGMPPMRR